MYFQMKFKQWHCGQTLYEIIIGINLQRQMNVSVNSLYSVPIALQNNIHPQLDYLKKEINKNKCITRCDVSDYSHRIEDKNILVGISLIIFLKLNAPQECNKNFWSASLFSLFNSHPPWLINAIIYSYLWSNNFNYNL